MIARDSDASKKFYRTVIISYRYYMLYHENPETKEPCFTQLSDLTEHLHIHSMVLIPFRRPLSIRPQARSSRNPFYVTVRQLPEANLSRGFEQLSPFLHLSTSHERLICWHWHKIFDISRCSVPLPEPFAAFRTLAYTKKTNPADDK